MKNESVLKKEFNEKEVQRLRNVVLASRLYI
jgi:hypothetical protein